MVKTQNNSDFQILNIIVFTSQELQWTRGSLEAELFQSIVMMYIIYTVEAEWKRAPKCIFTFGYLYYLTN